MAAARSHGAPLGSFVSVLLIISLFSGGLFVHVLAFKPQDFKTCEGLGFCKRNRFRQPASFAARQPGQTVGPTFVIDLGDAAASTGGDVANAGVYFPLSLLAYASGAVRIKMEERNHQRYTVRDVVDDASLSSTQVAWHVAKNDNAGAELVAGQVKAVVKYSPFKVEIMRNDNTVAVFNDLQKLHMEARRPKPAEVPNDVSGLWSETFNGHTDSKPEGPTSVSLDVSFPDVQNVYGLPERATSFSLKDTTSGGGKAAVSEPYRLYNLDVFEYLHESPFGLYGSIPYVVAHKPGQTAGVFWLNAAEMYVDVEHYTKGTSTHWYAESGIVDLFVFTGPTASDVMRQYAVAAGGTAMPPLWSLGYHQCRWNYRDEADVRMVDGGFDEHDIPYDVLWLDIEHTDGKRYMTWDDRFFPNPVKMQEEVTEKGRHMVCIVDPHVKRDDNYATHREAQQKGLYVKKSDGTSDFDGWCWPGSSSYLDVTDAGVRSWWSDKFSLANYKGSTNSLHIWNDMNEPSVFNGPEITMQKDLKHKGNVEHRHLHNMYGYYYHLATRDGLAKRSVASQPKRPERPFVLSRAFFAGTQKVGPIWTGDNTADWNHLQVSVPMLLALSVTGLPWSGADVGGFFGNPDGQLLARWYQLGVYYPFFRGHAHLDTKRREPWLFGEPYTSNIRQAIRTRYTLLPYLYTLFAEAHTDGAPIMRPVWYEFENDGKDVVLSGADNLFMLGPGLLVVPVTTENVGLAPGDTMEINAPGSSSQLWYSAEDGAVVRGGNVRIPVKDSAVPAYYRGGTIVARKDRARRSSRAMTFDPHTLVVALDTSGSASGRVFLDDGISQDTGSNRAMRRVAMSGGTLSCGGDEAHVWGKGTYTPAAEPSPEPASQGVIGRVFGTPPASKEVALNADDVARGMEVERVIFLGLPANKAFKAVFADGREEALVKSPYITPGLEATTSALTLRTPGVRLHQDWQLRIVAA